MPPVGAPSNLSAPMRLPRQIVKEALARLAERVDGRAYSQAHRRQQGQWGARGLGFTAAWPRSALGGSRTVSNPLRTFFNARNEGRGIWKWDHYFDVYHRHFERFRGTDVHILEIGIYSGGSLEMWSDYFGARCHVYGLDTREECLRYQSESISVFIGDQADRDFWRRFRLEVPKLDVVVDDGGHQPDQQATSLEELLPHLAPGGVYVVEDVHGVGNRFAAYTSSLIEALNTYSGIADHENPKRRKVSQTTGFQSAIDSIHCYPFVAVIEKRRGPVTEFVAPKQGTEWEPFLS
jgi:hypothetical protein